MPTSSIVDYGCGMGAFIAEAEACGVVVAGCDLSVPDESVVAAQTWRTTRFTTLSYPWEIDLKTAQAQMVFLLDVLEHHDDPASFVGKLKNAEVIVVKVPNSRGPLGCLSTACFGFHEGLFDRLALVGDVAPHLWFFTDEGLNAVMAVNGFQPVARLRIAEVGIEASNRSRSTGRGLSRTLALGLSGALLSFVSPLWSESVFRIYRRSAA